MTWRTWRNLKRTVAFISALRMTGKSEYPDLGALQYDRQALRNVTSVAVAEESALGLLTIAALLYRTGFWKFALFGMMRKRRESRLAARRKADGVSLQHGIEHWN